MAQVAQLEGLLAHVDSGIAASAYVAYVYYLIQEFTFEGGRCPTAKDHMLIYANIL